MKRGINYFISRFWHLFLALIVGYIGGITKSDRKFNPFTWSGEEFIWFLIIALVTLTCIIIVEYFRYSDQRMKMLENGCPIKETKLANDLYSVFWSTGKKRQNLLDEVTRLSKNGKYLGVTIPEVTEEGYLQFLEEALRATKHKYYATCLFSPRYLTDKENHPKMYEYITLVRDASIKNKIRIFIERSNSSELRDSLKDANIIKTFKEIACGNDTKNKVDHRLATESILRKVGVSTISDYAILDDQVVITFDRDAGELTVVPIAADGEIGKGYRFIFEELEKNPSVFEKINSLEPNPRLF